MILKAVLESKFGDAVVLDDEGDVNDIVLIRIDDNNE